ncbi:MAG: hypothetical protein L6Q95_11720 [Planctomycetes bacterium]|nr:hypothetical protein [Planctomycetota bacterium]
MRSNVRTLLLLPLLVALLLEGIHLVQPLLYESVYRAYPAVALDSEGRVVYYDVRLETDGIGRWVHDLDTTRNTVEILELGPRRATEGLVIARYRGATRHDFDGPRFLSRYRDAYERPVPLTPLEHLAKSQLQPMEAGRRDLTPTAGGREGTFVFAVAPGAYEQRRVRMPVEWRVENDRLVCRETATGRVLAGIGPDGYATGEGAAEGERFGRIATGPIHRVDAYGWLLLDEDGRRIHSISVAREQSQLRGLSADSLDLVPLAVETRALRPATTEVDGGATAFVRNVDRHVLVFLSDGSVIDELDLDPRENIVSIAGASLVFAEDFGSSISRPSPKPRLEPVGMMTAFVPADAGDERLRLRLFRPGQPAIVRDVLLTPTRAGEVILANLTASLALLRPPPLAVASALSPLPAGRRWWWRDPWLAAGSYKGWLALSLALAAFLAWRARRTARERCATARAVRLWTAAVFLLGPLGLLWMRLVLPCVPVEPLGGARRAVNLDASPSSSAPWPDPEPVGIEVLP